MLLLLKIKIEDLCLRNVYASIVVLRTNAVLGEIKLLPPLRCDNFISHLSPHYPIPIHGLSR
jgi:hypothetical protein